MKGMENRIFAKEWARNIMQSLDASVADRPYIEAVLVEAALFEDPVKELSIGINQVGNHINITIKGYENMINLVSWVNLFMSTNRDEMLCRVCDTFLQMPDEGAILVIQMEKTTFHTASEIENVERNPYSRRKKRAAE